MVTQIQELSLFLVCGRHQAYVGGLGKQEWRQMDPQSIEGVRKQTLGRFDPRGHWGVVYRRK
jgi:hypothetical protein